MSKVKNIKYKKFRKSRLKNLEFKANNLEFGMFGLKALESGIIKSNQILAAKQTILMQLKKKGKLWVRIFTDLSVTLKSVGARMGKGKGPVSHWVARVSRGDILFEICSHNHNKSISALKIAGLKLPVKTKIVS